MNPERDFLGGKKVALEKLSKASSENKVDSDILQVLNIINKSEDYYTSSSCAGRIVLLEIPSIGDKKEARFLGKWHESIKPSDILSTLGKSKSGQLWLLAQSPIIHISARAEYFADKMLKTAVSCGFKNSGLKSLGNKTVVEVCSTERLDSPVGRNGELFCKDEYLQMLVDISNDVLSKSRVKLIRFEDKLKEMLK